MLNRLLQTAAALALFVTATASQAQDFTFEVNPITGEVAFVNNTGSEALITGYDLTLLSVLAGSFDTGAVSTPSGATDLSTANKIASIGLLADFAMPNGSTSLGAGVFLPSGTPAVSGDFSSQVTINDTEVASSNVVLIPEPTALTLLGLTSLALVARRRKA